LKSIILFLFLNNPHKSRLSAALLEKETLDLQTIVELLGERPYAAKSNFKAYLEYKKKEEKFKEEAKEEGGQDGNDGNNGNSGESEKATA